MPNTKDQLIIAGLFVLLLLKIISDIIKITTQIYIKILERRNKNEKQNKKMAYSLNVIPNIICSCLRLLV